MRIAQARLMPFRLPLRQPWRTAAATLTERCGWLLCLETEDGRTGFGECTPLPEAGTETLDQAEARLEPWLRALAGRYVADTLTFLGGRGGDRPAARCALETALCDLMAQAAGLPLARWLNAAAPLSVPVNAVLNDSVSEGFAVFKLKIGLASPADEARRVTAVCSRLPTGARLRLDANRAWSESEAADFIAAVADLPVESLEEPLAEPSREGLARLQRAAPFALALDESLAAFSLPLPVPRAVIKVPRLGGLKLAFDYGEALRAKGHEVVVTTLMDAACGRLAALHLACALGGDLAHGLATGAWLAKDIGLAPVPVGGRLTLTEAPGLGYRAA